jgi:hypothetical protein
MYRYKNLGYPLEKNRKYVILQGVWRLIFYFLRFILILYMHFSFNLNYFINIIHQLTVIKS